MERLEQIDNTLKQRLQNKNISDYELEQTLLKRKKVYNHLLRVKVLDYERFTLNTSKVLKVSERTIQRHMRVAKAIKKGRFSEIILKKYKDGDLSYIDMIAFLKGEVQESELVGTPDRLGYNVGNSGKTEMGTRYCRECQLGKQLTCPYCFNLLVLCETKGYPILKKAGNEACSQYKP